MILKTRPPVLELDAHPASNHMPVEPSRFSALLKAAESFLQIGKCHSEDCLIEGLITVADKGHLKANLSCVAASQDALCGLRLQSRLAHGFEPKPNAASWDSVVCGSRKSGAFSCAEASADEEGIVMVQANALWRSTDSLESLIRDLFGTLIRLLEAGELQHALDEGQAEFSYVLDPDAKTQGDYR